MALQQVTTGVRHAADQVRPATTRLFFCQLVFGLWLIAIKVRAKRGQSSALQDELAKIEGIPARRGQDLWCRMELHALAEEGFLPSADRKVFRRDPGPLHEITEQQINQVAQKYGSLRQMLRVFNPPKARPPEERASELVSSLRKLMEDNSQMDLPSSTISEFERVAELFQTITIEKSNFSHRRSAGQPTRCQRNGNGTITPLTRLRLKEKHANKPKQ
jgi:hypothetical protein